MTLALQTSAFFSKRLGNSLTSCRRDAVLLLTETDLDWDEVLEILPADKLLLSAKDPKLAMPSCKPIRTCACSISTPARRRRTSR